MTRASRPEWTDEDIEQRVRQWTPTDEQPRVRALLEEYGTQPWHGEVQRVRRVLLQSSDGSLTRLRMLVDMAKRDYRDLLQVEPSRDD